MVVDSPILLCAGIDDYYRRVVHSPNLYPEENMTNVKCDTPGGGGVMELNIMQVRGYYFDRWTR
jgi:hypothetical protein